MCAEQEVVLRVEGISKQLGGKPILDNCSLTVRRGELKVLIGPSGAGKSTLLQCIDCLIPPDSGEIWLEGERLEMHDKRKLCAFRAQVGMIFQDFNLFDHLTAEENVAIALRKVRGMSRRDAKARALEELGRVGLARRALLYPAQLSGGQAQRVALARMLVSRPKALLLDEPFSAIDSHLRDQLQVDLLALLADFPGDMVIVTHSRDEAYHMCGQIAVMDAGRVLAHGPTKQVFADPRTVQGGRLTGCKNIFPARKVDDHTIFVPDWGVDLHPARMVEDGLVAMGVRAHSFRPEEVRNPLAVHCVGKMEEPFEWIIRMRAEGQTAGSPDLWWRVSKEIVPETMPTRLGVAPEQVLLFYE